MKHRKWITVSLIAAAGLTVMLPTSGCVKEVGWQPTYAIPLASGGLGINELIGAAPTEIQEVLFSVNGTDTVYSYQLVYTDTLDPIPLSFFGASGGIVPAGTYPLDEQDVFLRLTGKSSAGSFQFTNPSVEFVFSNETNLNFDFSINNTYTKNANTGNVYPFTITGQPTSIPGGTVAAPGLASLLVTNANSGGAMTNVFEPTPKYLYYTPVISVSNTQTGITDGNINVYSKVILPVEGFGEVSHVDTIPFNLNLDSLDEVANEAFEFAFLRLKFVNHMPLAVKVSGEIWNLETNTFIGYLPLYNYQSDSDSSITARPAATKQVIRGATPAAGNTTNPDSITRDIRIYRNHPADGKNDLELLSEGTAVLLTVTISTTDVANSTPVTILSNQKLYTNIGLKFQPNLKVNIQELRDSLTGF